MKTLQANLRTLSYPSETVGDVSLSGLVLLRLGQEGLSSVTEE